MARNRIMRGGHQVRETRWLNINPVEITRAAASSATLAFVFTAAELALRPFTIIRTRGVFGVRTDQLVATEAYSGSLGMAVVSEQATGIGVTAVPTPETDRDSDLFFVYESLAGEFLFADATSFQSAAGRWSTFDSKAMRKVPDGSDVAVTIETSSISSGAIFHISGRMLIKLH